MTNSVLRVWLRGRQITRHPAFPLALIALLTSFVVQPGHLGSVDTGRRLQVTRSFWTSEPPVIQEPGEDFGIVGRGGKLQAWYGMGQSLLMLPADVIATVLVDKIPFLKETDRRENGLVRRALVAYQISSLVCMVGVVVSFFFLELMGFSVNQAIAGALTLLFATTFLHYTQVAQENNFTLVMSLLGFSCQYRWFLQSRTTWLILGASAFGFNLLTRMTTGLDLMAGALFILLCLWRAGLPSQILIKRLRNYGVACLVVYSLFALIDRLYHFYRFGTFLGTYIHLFGEKWKLLHHDLPSSFPFSTPFAVGFLGPLITLDKSVFIFDPLIVVTLVLAMKYRKLISSTVKAFILTLVALLLSYISFYATYYDWSGNAAWGDRLVSTPVQLLAMMSLPLLLRYRTEVKSVAEKFGYYGLAALSVIIQFASVGLSYNLELIQMRKLGTTRFVVGSRVINLIAMATGNFEGWGLGSGIPRPLTSVFLMPFGNARELPSSVHLLITAVWSALLIMLMLTIYTFFRKISRGDYRPSSCIS
jgi:hypothetical protein